MTPIREGWRGFEQPFLQRLPDCWPVLARLHRFILEQNVEPRGHSRRTLLSQAADDFLNPVFLLPLVGRCIDCRVLDGIRARKCIDVLADSIQMIGAVFDPKSRMPVGCQMAHKGVQ